MSFTHRPTLHGSYEDSALSLQRRRFTVDSNKDNSRNGTDVRGTCGVLNNRGTYEVLHLIKPN
jgi:hypothetical protein